jgi:uncharacterized protein YoxC
MAEDLPANGESGEGSISDEQLMRAARSFEAIILSQIDIKNKLGDKINFAIRAGIIILGIVAVSILILLLTLSSQINRISDVVNDMNQDFTAVAEKMAKIQSHVGSMEQRVALLENITTHTATMDKEMVTIAENIEIMDTKVGGIQEHVTGMRHDIGVISGSVNHMNVEVQRMGADMHRMGTPARSMNKMFPFP